MSSVHASRGRLAPASPQLLTEVAIVCRLGRALLGDALPWAEFEADYGAIRDHASPPWCPGFADFERRVAEPGGFALPHGPRDALTFPTAVGPGALHRQPARRDRGAAGSAAAADDAQPRPVQHHDLRPRRPLPRHPRRAPGRVRATRTTSPRSASPTARWSTSSRSGRTASRAARPAFRVVAYPTARGCAATYFPEANVLVPLDSTAVGSHTPTSKQIIVRLEPETTNEPGTAYASGADAPRAASSAPTTSTAAANDIP